MTWQVGKLFFCCFFALAWNAGARAFGLYDEFRVKAFIDELSALGENILLQVFLAMGILFVIKHRAFSRFFVFAFCILSAWSLLLLAKLFSTVLRTWLQKNGRYQSRIIIIGAGEVASNFFSTIAANAYLGYQVIGFVSEQPPPGLESLHLGRIDQLAELLEREMADEVIIALPNSATKKIGQVIAVCDTTPPRSGSSPTISSS